MDNPFEQISNRLDRIESLLSRGIAEPDKTLTLEEAASYLRVSVSKLYSLARKGVVPAGKIGTRWLFRQAALHKWLEQKTRKPLEGKVVKLKKA